MPLDMVDLVLPANFAPPSQAGFFLSNGSWLFRPEIKARRFTLVGFSIRRKTDGASYFGRLIVGAHKSIYPIDRAPAEEQSEEQAHHQRGSHFPDVDVRAVHASPYDAAPGPQFALIRLKSI